MSIKPLLNNSYSIEDWKVRRKDIKKRFYEIIGFPPFERNTRDMKVLKEEKLLEYDRLKIEYIVGKNDKVYAYLLVPKKLAKKNPAILAMHQFQETDYGKNEPAGIGGDEELFIGHELALRGYVVLIPDYLTAGERIYGDNIFDSKLFYDEYPKWSMIGKNIEDSFSAVDILMKLDYVDENNVGVIGHSLGGHNSMLSLAFDDRVKVGVSNCGFSILSEEETVMEWVDETYNFMPLMKNYLDNNVELPFDFHEVAALICPCPWLNISSYYDGAYGNQEFLADVGKMLFNVYKLHNCETNFSYLLHGNNHSYPKYARDLSYGWLDRYLKHEE
ncbi:alpha/beta hydrolase family protein [Vallitalea okinawensis]|uniref:alpha/beta hydrolase family protein n=1 Tax=Vallitalea okinawensis TaxID=2078660 RepID=UPI001300334E|nr:prolyl oligopeptidase family serine peptidase [Vallitalea okinawensis]